MLTTVLFDMGGTLEDIWYNEDTQRATCRRLLEVLRANGLEPGCPDDVFWKRITDGVKAYKQWSEGNMLEKKPEEIWPDWYLRDFAFDREKLLPITEELANLWEVTFYHRELRDGAAEMLQALKSRGYHLGVISNNASLYNVFRVLEDYGHPRLYGGCNGLQRHRLSQTPSGDLPDRPAANAGAKPEMCVYVGDTVSRDIIGPKQVGFAKAVQIPLLPVGAEGCARGRGCGTAGQGYRNTDGPGDLAGPDQSRAGPRPRRITTHLICSLYFFLFLAERRPAEWPGRLSVLS